MAILQPAQLFDLGDVQILARGDARGLADMLDQRDGDEPALGAADDEGLAGIGAEIDLARHHLLHGEVAGRHGELLRREIVLFQIAGLHQIIGRHAPDVGLVALPDGLGRRDAARRAKAERQDAGAGGREIVPSRQC